MKTILLSLALASLLAWPGAARADDQNRAGGFQAAGSIVAAGNQTGGGYTDPGAEPMTVAEALKLGDNAWVSLTGRIENGSAMKNINSGTTPARPAAPGSHPRAAGF